MNEQDRFKKQLLKHTLYNICAFAIIFSIFGILIFCLVRNITYSSVDLTLKECADIYLEADNNLQGLSNYFIQSQGSKKEEFANSINWRIFAPLKFTKQQHKTIGEVGEWLKPPVC